MKPYGRSLSDFGLLWPAERQLLEHCEAGTEARVGGGNPVEATRDNRVRAEFIRFLALGGDEQAPVHEQGVQLTGAYVSGSLNLQSAVVPVLLALRLCTFERTVVLTRASLGNSLLLYGSNIKGLEADHVKVGGILSLMRVVSIGTINLHGAVIEGQITCENAHLDGHGDWALSASSAICHGSLHLRGADIKDGIRLVSMQIGGKFDCQKASITAGNGACLRADNITVRSSVNMSEGFTARGGVYLLGAKIGGQLACFASEFVADGECSLSLDSACIGGSLFFGRGFKATGWLAMINLQLQGDLVIRDAGFIAELRASRISIGGTLFLRGATSPLGKISLGGGRAGSLNDDSKSWGDELDINGFVYNFVHVNKQMPIADRLDWLDKQRVPKPKPGQLPEFYPQPWRQLQKVLDEMGHAEEARQVGIAFEHRLRKKGLVGQSPTRWPTPLRFLYRRLMVSLHWIYGPLSGYGYRPMLLLPWFLGVWLSCAALYWWAADHEAIFAPSDPLVFQNPGYKHCSPPLEPTGNEPAGIGNWYLCDALPQEYTAFSPIAFSLDLLLPLVNLHQEDDWAPVIETPKADAVDEFFSFFTSAKRWVRFVMWFEILAGWGFSLLFVAVVSGLARRKE
jgi:hypothetical protein